MTREFLIAEPLASVNTPFFVFFAAIGLIVSSLSSLTADDEVLSSFLSSEGFTTLLPVAGVVVDEPLAGSEGLISVPEVVPVSEPDVFPVSEALPELEPLPELPVSELLSELPLLSELFPSL